MTRRVSVLLCHREEIRELAARNKAETIALFGSVARGDDTEDSDCDFVAKFGEEASYRDLWRLELALEELLGTDVVSEGGLRGSSLSTPTRPSPCSGARLHTHRAHPAWFQRCRGRGSGIVAVVGVAADLIREAREAAGLTLAELAELARMPEPAVSRFESGLGDPRAETLDRLLRACGRWLTTAEPPGLPRSWEEFCERLAGGAEPTPDEVTRTTDGRELRTAEDVQAFIDELRSEGLLTT